MYARSACQWRNSGGPTGSARTLEITVTRARAFGCRSAINNRSSCCAISKGTAGNASLVRSRSRYLYDKLASLSGHCHSLSSGRFQGSDSSDRRGCRGLSLCWAGPAASPSARPRTTGGGLAVNPPGPSPAPPAGGPSDVHVPKFGPRVRRRARRSGQCTWPVSGSPCPSRRGDSDCHVRRPGPPGLRSGPLAA